jgi:hypothetical protein
VFALQLWTFIVIISTLSNVSLVQDDGILICSLLSARHTTANKGANNRAIIPFDNNRSIELMRLSDTGETEKERKRERERERAVALILHLV